MKVNERNPAVTERASSLNSQEHSPLPWRVESQPWHGEEDGRVVIAASGTQYINGLYVVCADIMHPRRLQAEIDYAFICRVANSHTALVEACEAALAYCEFMQRHAPATDVGIEARPPISLICTALSQAKGETSV